MAHIKVKVYKFKQLSDEAKDRVRQWYAECLDYDWWDFVYDRFVEEMSEYGIDIDTKDIHFSGFWSQGDGACFSVSMVTSDVIKYLKETKQTKKYWQLYINLLRDNIDLCFDIKGNDRWGHSMSLGNFDFTPYVEAFDNDTVCNKAYTAAEELATDVLEYCQDRAVDLYKQLEEEYDYLVSDESIKESCKVNGYRFTVDGRIV